jgi:hypothetical protein
MSSKPDVTKDDIERMKKEQLEKEEQLRRQAKHESDDKKQLSQWTLQKYALIFLGIVLAICVPLIIYFHFT